MARGTWSFNKIQDQWSDNLPTLIQINTLFHLIMGANYLRAQVFYVINY